MIAMNVRKYDIVLMGATGFTGKLVLRHLARNAPPSLRLAIAGRNHTKLNAVLADLDSLLENTIEIIVADSSSQDALDTMCKSAQVVISTVGPYIKHGLLLVDSCVRQNTHYVDLTGEPMFVRKIIEKHHEAALSKGVFIVPSCGFDSIPSDLGAFLIANHFKTSNATVKSIQMVVIGAKGGFSGGTLASGVEMIATTTFSDLITMASDPDFLIPNSIPNRNTIASTGVKYIDGLGSWVAPFIMEATNLRYVRRSAHLLGYGKDFQYSEGNFEFMIRLADCKCIHSFRQCSAINDGYNTSLHTSFPLATHPHGPFCF